LSRLRAELDLKLANAQEAQAAEKEQPTLETTIDAQNGKGARQSPAVREAGMPKAGPIAANVCRQGTKPTFEEFAGGDSPNSSHRVGADGMLSIANKFDTCVFTPPLKYLKRRDRDAIASYKQRSLTTHIRWARTTGKWPIKWERHGAW
jgi:hypothetical protein